MNNLILSLLMLLSYSASSRELILDASCKSKCSKIFDESKFYLFEDFTRMTRYEIEKKAHAVFTKECKSEYKKRGMTAGVGSAEAYKTDCVFFKH